MSLILLSLLQLIAAVTCSSDNVHLELISWGTPLSQELQVPPPPSKPSFVLLLVNDIPWTSSTLGKQSGRFSVRAPRGHGLLAVIQLVNLRKRNDYACSDYVKLSDPSGLLTSTTPICGSLRKENKSFTPEDLIGPRVFHSASGKIDVYYESEAGGTVAGANGNSNQVVEIVFTGYSECLQDTFSSNLRCGDKCISASLGCDEQLNCGFQEDFGVDEQNCTYPDGTRYRNIILNSQTQSKSSYVLSLYLGALVFVLILIGVGVYHRHTTYMRIKNIPT